MKQLQEIWDSIPEKTDKGDVHSYLPVYEELFSRFRHEAINVLEIGVFNGASIRLWENYFTCAAIHGIDCHEQPHGGLADLRPMIAEGTHNIHILDATSEYEIQKQFRDMVFHVIIDDGNHNIISQLRSYEILSKFLADGGVYVIEDIENIDETRELFEKMDATKNIEILDRRSLKGRFDDVLIIITDKK